MATYGNDSGPSPRVTFSDKWRSSHSAPRSSAGAGIWARPPDDGSRFSDRAVRAARRRRCRGHAPVRAADPLDERCDLHRLQFRVEGWAVRTSPYADTTATRLGRHGEVAG